MNKQMNHAQYQNSLKRKSVDELKFIAKDADEAARAFPENPNSGFYLDEFNYAMMEICRRAKVEQDAA